MKSQFLYLLIVLIGLTGLNIYAQNPDIKLCTFEQFVSAYDVKDIEQIGDVIFLATSGGLAEYNTNTEVFKMYTTNEGLRDNDLRALATTSEGVLWIGTNSGLCKFEEGCFFYETQPLDGSPYRVLANELVVDANDRIWISNGIWSGCRLMWFDEANDEYAVIHECDGLLETEEVIPLSLTADADGNIWMIADSVNIEGTVDRRLSYFNANTLQQTLITDTLNIEGFNTNLYSDNSGNIWLAINDQLLKYNTANNTMDFIGALGFQWISNFVVIDDENFLFTLPFDNRVFLNSTDNPLDLGSAKSRQVLSHGNEILIVTNDGLKKYNNQNSIENYINIPGNIKNNDVRAISADADGNIWVGYRNVLESPLMKYDITTGETTHFQFENVQNINHITTDGNQVYFQTGNELYSGNEAQGFSPVELVFEGGFFYYATNMLVVDEKIYLGAYVFENGVETNQLLVIEAENVQSLGTIDGRITELALNSEGEIFISADDGLYLYGGGELNKIIDNVNIRDMAFDLSQEILWLLRGDVEWFENFLYQYTEAGGLQEAAYNTSFANKIAVNSSGHIWMGGSVIESTDGSVNLAGPFSSQDGLPTNFINTIYVDEAGNVFIGSNAGLALFRDKEFIQASKTDICPGETISFSTYLESGVSWEIKLFNDIIESTEQSEFDFTFDNPGFYDVVFNTTIDGCVQTDIQSITVNPLAGQGGPLSPLPLCNDTDSVRLIINPGMMSYEWTFNGEVINTTSQFYTDVPGEYTVTVEDHCGGSATYTTVVQDELDFDIFFDCQLSENEAILSTPIFWNSNANFLWSTGATSPSINITEAGTYSVTVNLNGCEHTETIDFAFPCTYITSISDLRETIHIGPNPSNGIFYIETEHFIEDIQVSDLNGKLISAQINEQQINLENASKGIYFVTFFVNGEHVVKRLVKY